MVNSKRRLVLVIHDVRSAHNVGSLLRTADGLAVEKVYLTGFSPYPETPDDERPPHVRQKATSAVAKTALGAENTIAWEHRDDIAALFKELRAAGFDLIGLEQTPKSQLVPGFKPPPKAALVAGNEIRGLDSGVLGLCARRLEIPMLGRKESFNVAVAAAMALYHLRWIK